MTDARLRESERRWKETGALEDEAQYLRERVRAGELQADRLEVAALCGDEAARTALRFVPQASAPAGPVLVARLAGLGQEALVRAQIASALRVLGLVDSLSDQPSAEAIDACKAALNAAVAWVQCPCVPHARVAADRAAGVSIGPIRFSGLLAARSAALAAAASDARAAREVVRLSTADLPRLRQDLVPWLLDRGAQRSQRQDAVDRP